MEDGTEPRVLIADDEEAIRMLVVRVLGRAGFVPFEAADGRYAIEQLDCRPVRRARAEPAELVELVRECTSH